MNKVIETPCFPNAFKVVDTKWPTGNETWRYFPTYELAAQKAKCLNEHEEPK